MKLLTAERKEQACSILAIEYLTSYVYHCRTKTNLSSFEEHFGEAETELVSLHPHGSKEGLAEGPRVQA